MSGIVAVTEDRIINPVDFGVRIDTRFTERVRNEHLHQSLFLPHPNPSAAKLAHICDVPGSVPFQERSVTPAANNV